MRTLSYVLINVTVMARSVAFYRDQLGLKLRFESPYWSEFDGGGTKVALHGGAEGSAPPRNGAGTASLGFYVDDLRATHAQLVAKGVSFLMAPTERPEERIKLAVAVDPDGLVLNFTQPLG